MAVEVAAQDHLSAAVSCASLLACDTNMDCVA